MHDDAHAAYADDELDEADLLTSEELDDDEIIGPQPGPQTIALALSVSVQEMFFGGALAAGKSYLLALAVENQHKQFGGAVGAIIFRCSVPELDDLINTFREVLCDKFGWKYFVGKKTFQHPDGAWCRMRHVEDERDVKKYWGHAYTLMCFDELGDVTEKTFLAIQKLRAARLRSAKGVKVLFIGTGNPCGAGHKFCYERYIKPHPEGFKPFRDPESKHWTIFIPGKMENNIKMLLKDPEYKERCKSMGPAWYVQALINGDWSKSPEGKMFQREWFSEKQRYDLHNPPQFMFKFISWDTAFKKTDDSARSACTVWGATENGLYLLHAFADKLEFPELKRKAQDIYEAYKPVHYMWVEDKASGPSLVQSLKEDTTIPLRAIKVDQDKLRRAFVVTPFFESGKIFVPKSAPWLNDYIEELCSFPAPTSYADYVDSTSQAVTEWMKIKKRRDRWKTGNVANLNGSPYIN
jgi:predicted phage terminase large subunit-like protein